tara:strand:- start:56246 stop:56449 length:204 start_codon:yes stop_codon:yes gene_type:complete
LDKVGPQDPTGPDITLEELQGQTVNRLDFILTIARSFTRMEEAMVGEVFRMSRQVAMVLMLPLQAAL